MKNYFKITLLAIVVSMSIGACKGNKSGNPADSVVDSSSSFKSSSDTSVKVDTIKATDTSKAKTDTLSKTIKKHTETKKTVVKKD
jgi:hypothetical protein